MKPQSCCSQGKAAERKKHSWSCVLLLGCPRSTGLPMLQTWQDEGSQCTPSAPGTSWGLGRQSCLASPSLCQGLETQSLPGPKTPHPTAGAQLRGHSSPSHLPTLSTESLQSENTKMNEKKKKKKKGQEQDLFHSLTKTGKRI